MKKLIIKIEYDGGRYGGWQRQKNNNSIQEEIENALNLISGFKPDERIVKITGAGRTDAGVHARGQVAHCDLPDQFRIPKRRICSALNSRLPEDIRISASLVRDMEFNSRFDAIAREYSYTFTQTESVFTRSYAPLVRFPIDFNLLNKCAAIFLGEHDFTTFSKHNPATHSYICNVKICEWQEYETGLFKLRIKADRFVYGMVRSLTGVMIDAARGKRTLDNIKESLDKKDRKFISPVAPAKGLILERIYYPEEMGIFIQ